MSAKHRDGAHIDPMALLGAGGTPAKQRSRHASGRSSARSSRNITPARTPPPVQRRFFMGQKQFSIYEAMEKCLLARGDQWRVERDPKMITKCDVILGDRFDIDYSKLRTSIHAHNRDHVPIVNYFKGSHRLTLKASMAKFLRVIPNIDDIMPRTFVIGRGASQVEQKAPSAASARTKPGSRLSAFKKAQKQKTAPPVAQDELDLLRDEMTRHPEKVWIAKPSAGCKGVGITISKEFDQIAGLVAEGGTLYAVQEYIANPFLIDKRKFDIRVWALVAPPFDIYIFNQGSCRTASEPFSLSNLDKPLAHLTNHCLQEEAEDFGKFEEGNEMWYAQLQQYFDQRLGKDKVSFKDDVEPRLNDVVVKCLYAAKPLLEVASGERFECFQLFGFDLMLTDDLKVKLIEINGSPGAADKWLEPMVQGIITNVFDPAFGTAAAAAASLPPKAAKTVPSVDNDGTKSDEEGEQSGARKEAQKVSDDDEGAWVKVWSSTTDAPPYEVTPDGDLEDDDSVVVSSPASVASLSANARTFTALRVKELNIDDTNDTKPNGRTSMEGSLEMPPTRKKLMVLNPPDLSAAKLKSREEPTEEAQ